MTDKRRRPGPPAPPPLDLPPGRPLTSEEIFGELLDQGEEAAAPVPRAERPGPQARGPAAPAREVPGPHQLPLPLSRPQTSPPPPAARHIAPIPPRPPAAPHAPRPAPSPAASRPIAPIPPRPAAPPPPVAAPAPPPAPPPPAPPPAPEPPAPPARVGPGQTYGPYLLREKVAVGGMAEVYRATQGGIGGFEKVLAVKRLLPHLARDKELVEMFIDEAKLVAPLAHPNIVQIFDLGKIDRSYYIAMEYIHGRDLRSIQRRAAERGVRVPLDLAVHVVGKICGALGYAHHKKDAGGRPMQIVHRDVSPQNILISFEGEVKLADFGIARALGRARASDSNLLRGKLLYMSPEQAWGRPIDHRSDMFSLGLVFYELITEQKPFQVAEGATLLDTVRECHIPPPSAFNRRVPEKLERVVMKLLHPDPEQRYQDASGLLRALERAFEQHSPVAGRELARLMDVLFEPAERGAVVFDDGAGPGDGRGEGDGHEVEVDGLAVDEPRGRNTKDDMSIERLLQRFRSRR